MGKRGYAKKQAAGFCILGLTSLLGAFVVAWMGGHGYLNVDPGFAVPAGFVLLIGFSLLTIFSLLANVSFVTTKPWRDLMQKIDPSICRRVVKSVEFNKEYLVHGPCVSSLREVLLDDWPFEDVKSGSVWYVLDQRMNDVTDAPLLEIEGTVTLEVGL
jgi:hypothetical protein